MVDLGISLKKRNSTCATCTFRGLITAGLRSVSKALRSRETSSTCHKKLPFASQRVALRPCAWRNFSDNGLRIYAQEAHSNTYGFDGIT